MPITRSKRSSRKSKSRSSYSRGSYDRDDLDRDDMYPPSRSRRSSYGESKRSGRSAARQEYPPERSYSRRTYTPRRKKYKPVLGNLSPERKVDIIGWVMAVIGLLTILGLISANRGGLTGYWIKFLATIFGWGVPILAVAMVILGAWLIVRNIERLPRITIERVAGIILLMVNLLAILHGIAAGSTERIKEVASAGKGGGILGSLFLQVLVSSVGGLGTAIILVAWFVIALAMTLDLSMTEMFAWAGPLLARLRERLNQSIKKQASDSRGNMPPAPEPPVDFTPLERSSAASNLSQPPSGLTVKTGISAAAPLVPWVLPKVADILNLASAPAVNEEYVEQRARLIEETLASLGAPSQVIEISRGPTITQFGVEPLFIEGRNGQTRVRVSKIAGLADDLALALAAPRIRIQAPVPGRGYVGIEVPNEEMALVALREVVESEVFQRGKTLLRFALGKGVAGHPMVANLESMPHLLIAGTTGSGKSVCVNAILTCLLIHNTPDDLRFILVDPKRVELTNYNGIPHLLAPVVVEIERVVGALQWMTREMDNRYHKFAEIGARNIADYNTRMTAQNGKKLPILVVVIDELADLMMIAPDETERTITRLAQLARATGIHLIIATQRPSVDVVTGLIKANFPARIAFAVASNTDSRVILDQPGAERLLGRGDMLFQAPDSPVPVRLQGAFVSDAEIQRLVDYWRQQAGAASPYAAAGVPVLPAEAPLRPPDFGGRQVPMFEDITEPKGDPLYDDAVDLVRREGRCSVSMLQRRLRIGYTRSARLVDVMEDKRIVGPPDAGSGVRQVLDYGPAGPPKER